MEMIVGGLCKIVCHDRWIQRSGIILALLLIVLALSRHGTEMERSKNATSSCSTAQAHITMPTSDKQFYRTFISITQHGLYTSSLLPTPTIQVRSLQW